jgi:hypothetical protein
LLCCFIVIAKCQVKSRMFPGALGPARELIFVGPAKLTSLFEQMSCRAEGGSPSAQKCWAACPANRAHRRMAPSSPAASSGPPSGLLVFLLFLILLLLLSLSLSIYLYLSISFSICLYISLSLSLYLSRSLSRVISSLSLSLYLPLSLSLSLSLSRGCPIRSISMLDIRRYSISTG